MGTSSTGSWRWMICLSRFWICFIGLGLFKSMSVFVTVLVEYFNTTTSAVGFVVSLPYNISIVAGLLVGILLAQWEGRPLVMIGGIICVIGYIGAASSQTLIHLALWLTLSGFGQSAMYLVTTVSLLQYFPDDFAAFNGIALAGGAAGIMVLPPIAEQLLLIYGWRGALVILGAVSAHICVFGSLIRPLTSRYNQIHGSRGDSLKDTEMDDRGKRPIQEICKDIRNRLDFQLLVDEPRFAITQLIATLCGTVFTGWHIYLIPHCISLGFGETQSSFLATFSGIGVIVGRLVHGPFVDRGVARASDLFAGASGILAAVLLLDSLASSSYTALATLAAIAGFAVGVAYPLCFVMTADVPKSRQVSALAMFCMFQGIGLMSGCYLSGWIYDVTGGYSTVFNTLGGIALIMGALSMTLRLLPFSHTQ